jgi:hypothetical protein
MFYMVHRNIIIHVAEQRIDRFRSGEVMECLFRVFCIFVREGGRREGRREEGRGRREEGGGRREEGGGRREEGGGKKKEHVRAAPKKYFTFVLVDLT